MQLLFGGRVLELSGSERENERSKMHECMQTLLFFTNFISISIHCFKKSLSP